MNKNMIWLDILFYIILPFIIWSYGRESLGDYWAMLLSTSPGFIYTVFRFVIDRQFNITGTFILISLLIGTLVDLLSGSAERMLWNQVIVGLAFSLIYLGSLTLKKPLALYFFVDLAYLQGYERENSKKLFFRRELLIWFQLLTLLFVVRGVTLAGLKSWLIYKYGVDAYSSMLLYMRVIGGSFSVLMAIGYVFIGIKIKQVTTTLEAKVEVKV